MALSISNEGIKAACIQAAATMVAADPATEGDKAEPIIVLATALYEKWLAAETRIKPGSPRW